MAYQTDDEGMNDQQKDEKKRAKAERDQLKKDREAQREAAKGSTGRQVTARRARDSVPNSEVGI